MRLLLSFVRQYPWQCAVVFLCLLFASVGEGVGLTSLLPLFTLAAHKGGHGGDSGAAHVLAGVLHTVDLEPTLLTIVVVITIGLFLKAVLTLLAYRQVGYTVANIATDMRLSLLRALSMSRWQYFLRQRSGGLANAVATEATRSGAAFQSGANMVALATQSVIFFGVALLVNWKAALLTLLVGIAIFAVLRELVRMARRAGKKQQSLFRSLLSLLTDSLQSLKPLKSMARETQLDRVLERDTRKLNKAMRKAVLSKEALKAVQELLIGLVLVWGVYVSLATAYVGMSVSAVIVLAFVVARMLTKASKIQQSYQNLAVSESFYWSLQSSIAQAQAQEEAAFGRHRPTLTQAIELRDIGFGYDSKQVLDGVNLEIPAGRFTAVIGPSGAGKTTCVDLIIGLLRATGGAVFIDGVSIEDIDIRAWRRMIGYVPQETVLLHDSVVNNVTVGNADISEEDAVWALKKAGAWDFVQPLSEGLHTVVGERGGRFSGGQCQRIVIARALAHRPKLLILDEATTALDPRTEQEVGNTLRELGSEYTVLAISHQTTLMRLADRVYRIENGRAALVDRAERAATA